MIDFIVTPYTFICLVASSIALITARISWKKTKAPGGKALSCFLILVSFWTSCYAVEITVVGSMQKLVWAKISTGIFTLCPPLLLMMTIQYNRNHHWLMARWRIVLLYIIPFINLLLVVTNDSHHLVWKGVSVASGGNNLAVFEHGPAFWIGVVGYSCLIITIAVFFLMISIFRYPQKYRNQGFSLIFGILIPWVGNLLHISGLGPFPEIDLTPLVVIFMGLVMAINLTTNRLFDLMPVARATLIDTTPDGVLVLDDQGRLIDFNIAARDLLAHEIILKIGMPGNRIFARWPEILPFLSGYLTDEHEMTLNDGRGRYLICKAIPITVSVQHTAGRLMILRDSTQTVLIEEEVAITNELLRAQLDDIEQLQESLREQAVRDALTGLFNRRYLAESLQREFSRAIRDQSSISIGILDLDHFKIFNDTHGHMAGDELLKNLGAFLEENTRADDITCRYGGEEFVIVIPMLTCEEALQRLENIRKLFQKTPTIYQDEPFYATFSGGMATFPQHGKSPQDIMMAADRALYKAKALGRNCIMLAQPE